MGVIAKWNGHKFQISASVIRGFTQLQVKGSCETTETTASGEKYVTRKNTQPAEISLTAHLNAFVGCDVRKEAMAFVDEARAGKSDFFYVYQKKQYEKILKIKMMLVSADVSKVEIAPTGTWASADVALGMKACAVSESAAANNAAGTGWYGGTGTGTGYSKQSVTSTLPTKFGHATYLTSHKIPTLDSTKKPGLVTGFDITIYKANQTILQNKQKATAATVQKKTGTATKAPTTRVTPSRWTVSSKK